MRTVAGQSRLLVKFFALEYGISWPFRLPCGAAQVALIPPVSCGSSSSGRQRRTNDRRNDPNCSDRQNVRNETSGCTTLRPSWRGSGARRRWSHDDFASVQLPLNATAIGGPHGPDHRRRANSACIVRVPSRTHGVRRQVLIGVTA